MIKTLLPVSVKPFPAALSLTEARAGTFPHPAAQFASAALPLTEALMTFRTEESGASVQYELRLDGFLLMVTRICGDQQATFCAQRDHAAFLAFMDAVLGTLRQFSRARARALRGLSLNLGSDSGHPMWKLPLGDVESLTALLCRAGWTVSTRTVSSATGHVADFEGCSVQKLSVTLNAALSTEAGRSELLYVAALMSLLELIGLAGNFSEAAHRAAGAERSIHRLPMPPLTYPALLAAVYQGRRAKHLTSRLMLRLTLQASWPELRSLPAPERYVKGGVPLASKIAGRYARGFSKPLRAALRNAALPETELRRMAQMVRQSLKVASAAEIEPLLAAGQLSSPLVPVICRRLPGARGGLSGLRDLRAVTLELARHEFLSELTDGDLPERFWREVGFSQNTEQRLMELRRLVAPSQSSFAQKVETAYRLRCHDLGVPSQPLKGQPFALKPDAWNQDLPVTHEGQTALFFFRTCASELELETESDEMIHCVGRGSYTAQAASGNRPIISVRASGDVSYQLAFTVELGEELQVRQARGKRNADLGPLQHEALRVWLKLVADPQAVPTAPQVEWQSERAAVMSGSEELQRVSLLQAQARLDAQELVLSGLQDADVTERAERERRLRRRLLGLVQEIDRVAVQALKAAQLLLRTDRPLTVGEWSLPGENPLTLLTMWSSASATLFDTPYGPSLSLFQGVSSPELLDGPVKWSSRKTVYRVHAGGLLKRTQGVGQRAQDRRLRFYSQSFEQAYHVLPGWARELGAVMCGDDLQGDLRGSLRPSRLPRRLAERQALMDAWTAKKAALGLEVSDRGVLVASGTELHVSLNRIPGQLVSQEDQVRLLSGSLESLLRGEGAGFAVVSSQVPAGQFCETPLPQEPAFELPILEVQAAEFGEFDFVDGF